jgi:endonuclease G, mitochondrial
MFHNPKTILLFLISLIFSSSILLAGPVEDCAEYAKLGVPGNTRTLLCRTGHLLSHSPSYKTPIWVIEHLTSDKANSNNVQRSSARFQPDPDLSKGERAELSDYKGSGYDRGHMAPAADMKWDEQAMKECFYLSNMVPQVGKGMNQGIWKDLEEKVRDWAIQRGEIYIFTGPIYDDSNTNTIGSNNVGVPAYLYKIIYDPNKKEAISFIMPNTSLKSIDMPKYIVTIREVEEKTGLDFLSNLNKNEQDAIETKKAKGLWE